MVATEICVPSTFDEATKGKIVELDKKLGGGVSALFDRLSCTLKREENSPSGTIKVQDGRLVVTFSKERDFYRLSGNQPILSIEIGSKKLQVLPPNSQGISEIVVGEARGNAGAFPIVPPGPPPLSGRPRLSADSPDPLERNPVPVMPSASGGPGDGKTGAVPEISNGESDLAGLQIKTQDLSLPLDTREFQGALAPIMSRIALPKIFDPQKVAPPKQPEEAPSPQSAQVVDTRSVPGVAVITHQGPETTYVFAVMGQKYEVTLPAYKGTVDGPNFAVFLPGTTKSNEIDGLLARRYGVQISSSAPGSAENQKLPSAEIWRLDATLVK